METETLLETIIKEIVKYPDEVKIEKTVGEMGILLSVKVNPEDMALLIGKKGTTISAIRLVMQMIGRSNQQYLDVKLIEPEKRFERKFNQREFTRPPQKKENLDSALGKL